MAHLSCRRLFGSSRRWRTYWRGSPREPESGSKVPRRPPTNPVRGQAGGTSGEVRVQPGPLHAARRHRQGRPGFSGKRSLHKYTSFVTLMVIICAGFEVLRLQSQKAIIFAGIAIYKKCTFHTDNS